MGSFNFFPGFIRCIIKITLKNFFFCPKNDGVTRNFQINSLFACLFGFVYHNFIILKKRK